MLNRGIVMATLIGAMLVPVVISSNAYADSGSSCGSTETFFNWSCDSDDDSLVVFSVLTTILNWVAAGVSVIVIIGILYGAIMYGSARGDEAQAKKGIGIIRNAIIALLLYFAMYSLLQWLIPGGLFNA